MLRRIFQFGGIVLLIVGTIVPLLEFFDRWDVGSIGLSSDTELCVAAVLLGLGIAFSVAKLLQVLPAVVSLVICLCSRHDVGGSYPQPRSTSGELTPSPPLICLRI